MTYTLAFITNGSEKARLLSSGSMGIGTPSPHASALVDMTSATRGFLPPRMTSSQMNAIGSPAEGLTVYNTTLRTLCVYNGESWSNDQEGKSCGTISFSGKTYETIVIGYQCWMKQSLNAGVMVNGTLDQTNNGIVEKYCYDNLTSNCDLYGGLYQWDEAMNYTSASGSNPSGRQGICPDGWHIPSDEEWCQMETHLDPTVTCNSMGLRGTDAGGKMKEEGTLNWNAPNLGATNSSGFTALPGGTRATGGFYFNNEHQNIYFHTTTESNLDPSFRWFRYLYYDSAKVLRDHGGTANGRYVRCCKD
jgi:uncharacterized protein (TIGR02145 family)